MDRQLNRTQRWLDTAVGGIRFGYDREAVRAELAAHLEDKAADFRRIFPGMTGEEAEQRAVDEMGDAAELGRELAKIHRPWLGWLWRASKWIAVLSVVLLLVINILNNDHYQSAGYPLWGGFSTVRGRTEGEKIQLGGYTFQIVGAAYLDYVQDWRGIEDRVQVYIRVSTPRFWERINEGALQSALTMTGPEGWAWSMDSGKVQTIWEEGRNELVCGLQRAEWGLFHDTYVAYGDLECPEGEPVCLEFDFGKGSFTLTVDQLERVVME